MRSFNDKLKDKFIDALCKHPSHELKNYMGVIATDLYKAFDKKHGFDVAYYPQPNAYYVSVQSISETAVIVVTEAELHIARIQTRISTIGYQLAYAQYNERYSSASYYAEIQSAEHTLREYAELTNQMGVSVPKQVGGYCDEIIDLVDYGFKYFI